MNGILIIESDRALALRMSEVLAGVTTDICLAHNGTEAFHRLREQPLVVVANGVVPQDKLAQMLEEVAGRNWWMPALITVGVAPQALGAAPNLAGLPKDQHLLDRLPAEVARWYFKLQADLRVAQMHNAMHQWEATFDAVGAAIWVLDKQQRILRCNQATKRLFGKDQEAVVGRHCWEVVHGSPLPPPDCPVNRMRRSLRRESMEFSVGERWFEVVVDPILDPAGEYQGAVHIVSDITARKQTESELRRLYEQTQRDARVKSELITEINHRVRNNLISILGLIQTEQQHACGDQCQQVVKNALDNLGCRIQGLIEVHRLLSDTEWNPMPVSELAHCIISTAAAVVEPGKQVRVEVTPTAQLISPRQANSLALILNELATNTLKYAARGRMMTAIKVSVENEGAAIRVVYQDDGPGYPADVLNGLRCGVGLVLLNLLAKGAFRGTVELKNDQGAVAILRLRAEEIHRT